VTPRLPSSRASEEAFVAQRAKRLTKKERQALGGGPRPAAVPGGHHHHHHIHCTACGLHLDEEQFDGDEPEAVWLTCEHGSSFPSCAGCDARTRELLAEHDRTNQPVRAAQAWH
jgi:hypothetical protein